MFVVLEEMIYVLSCESFDNIFKVKTNFNPESIFSLSNDNQNDIISYPGEDVGSIIITDISIDSSIKLKCHRHKIKSISLSNNGLFVCTSSINNSHIRIFKTTKENNENIENKLNETYIDLKISSFFEKFLNGLEIYSICFSKDNKYLAYTCKNYLLCIINIENKGNPTLLTFKKSFDEKQICFFRDNDNLIIISYKQLFKEFKRKSDENTYSIIKDDKFLLN